MSNGNTCELLNAASPSDANTVIEHDNNDWETNNQKHPYVEYQGHKFPRHNQ